MHRCWLTNPLTNFIRILQDCYPFDEDSVPILRLLNQEIILSYRLLFGQTKASRRHFQKVVRKKVMSDKSEVDPLLQILCTRPMDPSIRALPADVWPPSCRDYDGQLLEQSTYSTALDFPLLGSRLLKIQEFDQRHHPYKLRDLWRDRRNPLQWYAFWAINIIGGVTIVIGLCQLAVSLLQLAIS